jgi:hypothetical protein
MKGMNSRMKSENGRHDLCMSLEIFNLKKTVCYIGGTL